VPGEAVFQQTRVVPSRCDDYGRGQMEQPISAPVQKVPVQGVLCGAGSALCWALGFVAARHGVLSGMSPLVLALHRFVWPGIVLLPILATNGLSDLGGLGWRRGIILTVFGGLPLASHLGPS